MEKKGFLQDEAGQWWRTAHDGQRRRAAPKMCPKCKNEFPTCDSRQVFCSHSCAAETRHAAVRSTTPALQPGPSLINSDNPHFTLDDKGQWWYLAGPSASRTRARIRDCARCGKPFLTSIFHPSPHCSRSCGLKASYVKDPNRQKGCRASNWKGGRRIDHRGYVLIHATAHPSPRRVGGLYMFEHRLVMEKVVGRMLEPHEQVHHKNGIRDDNRPENLELWVKQQPPGARVHEQQHCPSCTCFS